MRTGLAQQVVARIARLQPLCMATSAQPGREAQTGTAIFGTLGAPPVAALLHMVLRRNAMARPEHGR